MQINTRKDKEQLCEIAIENSKKLTKALEEIKNGESEGAVCHKYNITKSYIRYHIFHNDKIFNSPRNAKLRKDDEKYEGNDILLSGGERLYNKVAPYKVVPYDASDAVEYFLKNGGFKRDEIKMLRMRYWEGLTLDDIGKTMGLSRERIRQIESKVIRKIRVKFHSIIEYGYTPFLKQRNEKLETLIKEREAELAKYNKLVQESKRLEEEIVSLKENNKEKLEQVLFVDQQNETIGEFIERCKKNENISTRLYNSLKRTFYSPSSIWTADTPIKDMGNYTRKEIMEQVRNLGERSSRELEYLLSKIGIHFKEES